MEKCFYYDGPIGRYCLFETRGQLTHLCLGDRLPVTAHPDQIRETALLEEANKQLDAYFQGLLKKFDLPLKITGTPFQEKVWKALCTIPYGSTITYGELAARTGNPQASRAVGMANSRNPLPIFIPCHRVIGAVGKLTGYTGGLFIKKYLLQLEQNLLLTDNSSLNK